MKAFIVYPTYKIEDGKAYVHLFGRLENGESFLTINEFKPYFYICNVDLAKAKLVKVEGIKFETEYVEFKNFANEEVVKLILTIPSDVSKLRKAFEENKIETYEADVRFAYRFMMDKELSSSMEIPEGSIYDKGDNVDRLYIEPELEGINTKEAHFELKTLSIDLETDGLAKKLYSISLYTKGFEKVIFVNRSSKPLELNNAIVVADEKEALLKFKELVLKIDPDIITGWNVVDFDLAMLFDKFKQHRIPFKICRNDMEATVRIEDSFYIDSKARIPGRVVLDGLQLLKNTFYKLEDFKLDTAASVLLGEKKLIGNENKLKEIEDSYANDPQKLVDYNLKDSELVYRILDQEKLIELTIHRAMLVGMPLDRVQASVASLDSLYLRALMKKRIVASSGKINKKEKGITGGFVMDSKPGIYDNVIVCDFKSLYPSVMRTFNIDPMSFFLGKTSKDFIEAPNGARFDKKEGLLPSILASLWADRDEMKKQGNKVGSYAIKIHMNSIYGVLANPTCRFYDYDLANAITTFSRKVTQDAAALIAEKGFDVIYGDTDSVFINLNVENVEEAKKIGKEIEIIINNHYKKLVEEEYKRNNIIEMEFEKLYTRFMIPFARGSTEGAKKRYAGLLLNAESGEAVLDFTGLEFVRRDWTAVSKKFQLELLERIFHKKEVQEYIKEFVKEIKEGKYNDLLMYRKALRKATDEYIKTTPPHVKAARILEEAGKLDSSIIEYFITTNGPEPRTIMKSAIDYNHYIEKQIKPIADSVLVFFDSNFDDLIAERKQKSLFDY